MDIITRNKVEKMEKQILLYQRKSLFHKLQYLSFDKLIKEIFF